MKFVLLIDDEDGAHELLSDVLLDKFSEQKISIFHAYNGDEVKKMVKNSGIKFDCIFTDINMPLLNGLEFLKFMQVNYSDVKVYVVTAYDNDELRSVISSLGAKGLVSKSENLNCITKYI
jgi:DNA-binding NarL/FixJ family response regulator